MSRYKAREEAFKLVFEATFKIGEDIDTLINQHYGEDDCNNLSEEKAYFEEVVRGVLKNNEKLNENIEKQAIGWKTNRISRVSSTLLKIAMYEIDYLDYIPNSVAVNEAVELAKKYDSPEAASFINGILGSHIRQKDSDKPKE